MKRSIFIFVLTATILSACSNLNSQTTTENPEESNHDALEVVTTFYPLYDFTSKVTGNEAHVENLVPAGIEPHDYEPSPREIQKIYEADLFVYNGAGVDGWVDNLLDDLEKNGVKVINMSKTITLLDAEGEGDHDHENDEETGVHEAELEHEEAEEEHHEEASEDHEEEAHGHDHSDLAHDPHFWLDPVLAEKQVEAIRDALVELKPESQNTFENNAEQTLSKLITLDNDYKEGLQACRQNYAIVTHNAFRYLEEQYHINLLPISGVSPEEEPSARALAELANLSKEHNIKYVFFETLASPDLAETLANEIDAKTLVLNPIEGITAEEQKNGEDYFSIMRENLNNLKTALECQ